MPMFSDPVVGLGSAIVSAFKNTNDIKRLSQRIGQIKHNFPDKMAASLFVSVPVIVTWHVDAFKQIISTDKDKFYKLKTFSGTFEKLLGESVLLTEKEEWRFQRKIMNPSFHFEHLKNLTGKFIKITNLFVDKLNNLETFEPTVWFSKMTLDALGLAGFGSYFKSLEGGLTKEYNAYNLIIKELTSFARVFPIYEKLPIESNRKLAAAVGDFDEWMNKIIKEKKEKNLEVENDSEECDLLDLLVQSHNFNSSDDSLDEFSSIKSSQNNNENEVNNNKEFHTLSDKQLKQNIFLFFLAGHETTSGSLTFIIDFLSKNEKAQQKCREEVYRVIGKENEPHYDTVKDLDYISAVIKESMRLSSPVGALSRVANEDTTLNGYFVPKGTIIFLVTEYTQKDPDIWENPDQFIPERWLDDKQKVPPFAYMPFGAGPRVCIGFNFALLEMKIVLSMLLQRFAFFPTGDQLIFNKSFTLRPQDGYRIGIRKLRADE